MKKKFLSLLIVCVILACSAFARAAENYVYPGTLIDPAYPVPEYVTQLLSIAAEEVGYREEDHGRSKYGEWAGDPYAQWCAEFLCWCVDQTDIRFGTSLLRNVYPMYSGSNTGRAWFITQGRFVCRWGNIDGWGYQWLKGQDEFITTGSYIPQPGDWVFFTWTSDTDTDHVAMVENCSIDESGTVWVNVFEGNKPSAVERFSYELTNSRILGFGTVHDVMDVTLRFGNEGEKVKILQQKLNRIGYLEADLITGHFGNGTVDAIVRFQTDHSLKSNGIANIATQKQLDIDYDYVVDHDPLTWTVIDEDE